MFPSPAIPRTRPDSSIRLQEPTRRSALRRIKSISPLHPAAARDVHCTRTIWQQVLLPTQFAGSSSVPAHVEMMGLIGMGNNPMVGATVAVAVAVQEAADAGKF